MKLQAQVFLLLVASLFASSIAEVPRITTTICLQSITSNPGSIIPLAEIQYDPFTLSAEFNSFDAPELPFEASLVQIGICDPAMQIWKSSRSVTSAESFGKGYAPIMVVSLDIYENIIGIACKSVKVDAGHTRDFGPKVRVVKMSRGKTPDLNRPVVVSKEGLQQEEAPEKTLLQKYWWVAAVVMVLLLATGGGDK